MSIVSSSWFIWVLMFWIYGHNKYFNSFSAGIVFIRQNQEMSDQINWTRIAKIYCGRHLVNIKIAIWRRWFLHKYNYFSSFGAGNCVSNSRFRWMKNKPKQLGSISVKLPAGLSCDHVSYECGKRRGQAHDCGTVVDPCWATVCRISPALSRRWMFPSSLVTPWGQITVPLCSGHSTE